MPLINQCIYLNWKEGCKNSFVDCQSDVKTGLALRVLGKGALDDLEGSTVSEKCLMLWVLQRMQNQKRPVFQRRYDGMNYSDEQRHEFSAMKGDTDS